MTLICSSGPLEERQLNRLSEYKYCSVGASICDQFLKGFWNRAILYTPKHIAPNTLTLIGLLANILGVSWIFLYAFSGNAQINAFPLVFFSFTLFVYQTLDALDGLQARRTGSSSQLGELFDHGCDAISICFDQWPKMMFIQYFAINSLFYISHWQCYMNGYLQFDKYGVTEVQLIAILFSLVSAVTGVEFWSTKIPVLGLELKLLQCLVFMFAVYIILIRFGGTISQGGSGKHGTTIANTSVLSPGGPLLLTLATAVLIALRSPSQIYTRSPHLYLLSFGVIQAKFSQVLVIAHMTKSGMSLLDSTLIGPVCLLINQFFSCPLDEIFLLWCSFTWSICDLIIYDVRVCHQLANHLGIYVFRITPRSSTRPNSTATSTRNSDNRNPHYLRSQARNAS